MVECKDLADEALDSAAYTWAALQALGKMAAVLGDEGTAQDALERADATAARFDADWWDPESGLYAMSLQAEDNRRLSLPHWAVITPLEVGLASPEHARQTFETLRRGYLNGWGLKHSGESDERVWTLPTALLSRAAYRYGEPGLGFEMLGNLAKTLEHGSIGLFHELIPQGACIVQLWSAACFVRGVVEDLLGIAVDAAAGCVTVKPQLPAGWQNVRLEGLRFGERCVDVEIVGGAVTVVEKARSPV
jgi:glycogen debranching enzyme